MAFVGISFFNRYTYFCVSYIIVISNRIGHITFNQTDSVTYIFLIYFFRFMDRISVYFYVEISIAFKCSRAFGKKNLFAPTRVHSRLISDVLQLIHVTLVNTKSFVDNFISILTMSKMFEW